MRVRVRGPAGQSTITLDATATVADLTTLIKEQTGLASFDLKYGYPQPQPLDLSDPTQKLAELGVDLNGEQLIVNSKKDDSAETPPSTSQQDTLPTQTIHTTQPSPLRESSLIKPPDDSDPPEVPSPEHAGTVVLRIMPDDNSCLFRAVGSAVIGGMDAMTELRSIVAQTIQAQPDEYPEVVLERKTDDYCRWIQSEDAWGGAIELSILSKHFAVEICSIDVQTLRVDRFNEGQATKCFVVYSGIHYDAIALSPSDPPFTHAYAPPDFDTRIFEAGDSFILERALELCQVLQKRHYYTDTTSFQIRCNTCGGLFVGEKGATEHAAQTGHYDFGEAQ
ncbi:OTU-like cysteine protease [Talaromyces proteolyticus]|uniref:Ubiquitin thioesterase OTU n=1 Tax=Talaromyces proteolyticus TaxID=1131652 RepID=A0AAD4KEG4_9EURO|nr:OTU-like cysteine protease [Talaromyces proteolyticus]KAH8688872.1 OTU-like cysteine protease [Talaromyces proteolyticus]